MPRKSLLHPKDGRETQFRCATKAFDEAKVGPVLLIEKPATRFRGVLGRTMACAELGTGSPLVAGCDDGDVPRIGGPAEREMLPGRVVACVTILKATPATSNSQRASRDRTSSGRRQVRQTSSLHTVSGSMMRSSTVRGMTMRRPVRLGSTSADVWASGLRSRSPEAQARSPRRP